MKFSVLRVAFLLFALLWVTEAGAVSRFLTCSTSCTITAIDTTIWGSASGGTGASVPVAGDDVILDTATCVGATTCTATMGPGYSPTWLTLTMGACTASTTGCVLDFSVSNNSITITSSLSFTGTGTRALKCGSGTFTFTGTSGNVVDNNVLTNGTLTCGSAPLVFTATTVNSRNFRGGGSSYGALTVNANSSRGQFTLLGANTFASLSAAAGTTFLLPTGTTTTITAAPTLTGTASLPISFINQATGGASVLAFTSGTFSIDYGSFWFVTVSGGTARNATNSFDMGDNSGFSSFTGPTAGGGGGRIIGG